MKTENAFFLILAAKKIFPDATAHSRPWSANEQSAKRPLSAKRGEQPSSQLRLGQHVESLSHCCHSIPDLLLKINKYKNSS